jgi:hypothetical protein
VLQLNLSEEAAAFLADVLEIGVEDWTTRNPDAREAVYYRRLVDEVWAELARARGQS